MIIALNKDRRKDAATLLAAKIIKREEIPYSVRNLAFRIFECTVPKTFASYMKQSQSLSENNEEISHILNVDALEENFKPYLRSLVHNK